VEDECPRFNMSVNHHPTKDITLDLGYTEDYRMILLVMNHRETEKLIRCLQNAMDIAKKGSE